MYLMHPNYWQITIMCRAHMRYSVGVCACVVLLPKYVCIHVCTCSSECVRIVCVRVCTYHGWVCMCVYDGRS